MFNWTLRKIEALRQEPEEQRRHVALIAAASVTGLMFLGWISSLGSTFVAIEGTGVGIEEQASQAATALSAVSDNTATQYLEVRGSVDEALSSLKTAPAEGATTTPRQ